MVAATGHLARQACQWLPTSSPEDENIRGALLRWLRAFPVLLMCHVREEEDKMDTLLQGCVPRCLTRGVGLPALSLRPWPTQSHH